MEFPRICGFRLGFDWRNGLEGYPLKGALAPLWPSNSIIEVPLRWKEITFRETKSKLWPLNMAIVGTLWKVSTPQHCSEV